MPPILRSRLSPMSLGSRLIPPVWHERLQFDRYPIHDFVRSCGLSHLKPGVEVLDAGSGRLPEQHLRSEILATGATLTTLDLFPGEGVDVAGDIAAMPFPSGSFDVVLCTQVLEHVPDPRAVCRELSRVLRPGGVALVTAPQSAWLHNLPHHYFHFTSIGLKGILEEAGFRVDSVKPQGGHFITLALHLHYTARVLEERFCHRSPLGRRLAWPVLLLWRAAFGLGFKAVALGLDQWIPHEGNTQGWNVLARRERETESAGEP